MRRVTRAVANGAKAGLCAVAGGTAAVGLGLAQGRGGSLLPPVQTGLVLGAWTAFSAACFRKQRPARLEAACATGVALVVVWTALAATRPLRLFPGNAAFMTVAPFCLALGSLAPRVTASTRGGNGPGRRRRALLTAFASLPPVLHSYLMGRPMEEATTPFAAMLLLSALALLQTGRRMQRTRSSTVLKS